MYFVFCRLYPAPPPSYYSTAVFGSYRRVPVISLHCIAGAGLHIHVIGEVLSDQTEDEHGPLILIPRSTSCLEY
jgi:hypothetical protein